MKKIKSVFTDKASLILRMMLEDPKKKWVASNLSEEGISTGWLSEILTEMSREGYVERVHKGPLSYSILKYPDKLITDWVKWYKFKYNTLFCFYSPLKNIEVKLINYFKKKNIPYALTLFSGAKRIAPYVNDQRIHVYIPSINILEDLVKFRESFNLMELKDAGNIYFVIPYYKNSIFKYLQYVQGVAIVSTIQLYLDLYTFSPRGKEQAEYLLNFIRRKEHGII